MSHRNVFFVDNDNVFLESTKGLLESHEYLVVTFKTMLEFLKSDASLSTGCLLSGDQLPGTDLFEAQSVLTLRRSALSVIFVTSRGNSRDAVRAIVAGATDYIEKPLNEPMLLAALERALEISRKKNISALAWNDAACKLKKLTSREREIFGHLAMGESNKEVAMRFQISPRTVEVHHAQILRKTDSRGLADLVMLIKTASSQYLTQAETEVEGRRAS